MICRRCLLRLSRTSKPSSSTRRHITNSSSRPAEAIATSTIAEAKPEQGSPERHQPPASTSTSATQPFSTPYAASPTAHGETPKKKAEAPVVLSSCPAGTPLKGLNFLRNKSDPVAMEDSEYPSWLWDILKPKQKDEAVEAGDLFSKSKAKRQKAKRAQKLGKLDLDEMAAKVPFYEQTIDLSAGDGTVEGNMEAAQVRKELTKAMRGKRRATIKEDNFLRTMK